MYSWYYVHPTKLVANQMGQPYWGLWYEGWVASIIGDIGVVTFRGRHWKYLYWCVACIHRLHDPANMAWDLRARNWCRRLCAMNGDIEVCNQFLDFGRICKIGHDEGYRLTIKYSENLTSGKPCWIFRSCWGHEFLHFRRSFEATIAYLQRFILFN